MSPWVMLNIYNYEIYGHYNSFNGIRHMLFIAKSMLVDYDIGGWKTQELERD